MHLRKLEIATHQGKSLAYRFYPGEKEQRYCYGVQLTDRVERELFLAGCRLIFDSEVHGASHVSQASADIAAVQMECYDDTGTIWTVVKDGKTTTILRDGERLKSMNEASAETANLGLPFAAANRSGRLSLGLGSFHKDRLVRFRSLDKPPQTESSLEKILEKKMAAVQLILGTTPSFKGNLLGPLAQLREYCDVLITQYQGCQLFQTLLKSTAGKKTATDEFQLREQIQLLKKVESAFQIYLNSQKIASHQLDQSSHQKKLLKEVNDSLGATSMGALTYEDVFDLALAFVSMQANSEYTRRAQDWRQLVSDRLQPDFRAHLEQLEQLILLGAHLNSRIDMEIRNGNASSDSPSQPEATSGWFGASRFLLKNMMNQMKSIEDSKRQFRHELRNFLQETSLVSLKIGEIRDAMSLTRNGLHELQEKTEQITKSSVLVEENESLSWSQLALKYQLPEDIAPSHFFQVLGTMLMKIQLEECMQNSTNNLTHLHAARQGLIKAISEWRHLTKSVDLADLTDDSVLVTEARKLSRYLHDKEELRRMLLENKAEITYALNLEKTYLALQQGSRQTLEKMALLLGVKVDYLEKILPLNQASALLTNLSSMIDLQETGDQIHALQIAKDSIPFQIIVAETLVDEFDLQEIQRGATRLFGDRYFARIVLSQDSSGISDFTEQAIGYLKPIAGTLLNIGKDLGGQQESTLRGDVDSFQSPIQKNPLPNKNRPVLPNKPHASRLNHPLGVQKPSYADQQPVLPRLPLTQVSTAARPSSGPHPLAKHDKPLSNEARKALEILTRKPPARNSNNKT